MNTEKIKKYLIHISIPVGVGLLATLFTYHNMNIFDNIKMPKFAPPTWLFPIVWTILYILMGVSFAMISKQKVYADRKEYDWALKFYAISLAMNFFWNIIFFNFRAFWFAFVWLIILLSAVLATIVYYLKINKKAAYLQLPYFVWICFAKILTFSIAILNA